MDKLTQSKFLYAQINQPSVLKTSIFSQGGVVVDPQTQKGALV